MMLGFMKAVSLPVAASSSAPPGPDGAERCSETSGSCVRCRCFLVLLRGQLEGGDAGTVGFFKEERKRAFQQKPGGGAFCRFNKS